MENTETKSVAKQDANPLSKQDKQAHRIEPDIETDTFSPEEMKEIVKMVLQDAKSDLESMSEWIADRKLDVKMYNGDKPSVLENLTKKGWQSDRNLGQCAATCDSYQATLLATCVNPETIHVKSAKENDVDRRDNITKFIKWGLGRAEADFHQEADDFIHNRVTQGFSVFKVYWKVWYQWVDRRIPKHDKDGNLTGYEIKTEKVRFEKGVIENVANVEDFLTPTFGKHIQDLDHCIHVLHMTGLDLIDFHKRKIFAKGDEKFVNKLKNACYDWRLKSVKKEKGEQLGLRGADEITNVDMRVFPAEIFEWYGWYTKNGRTERYKFCVEPTTETFLSGKPLRKVPGCRTGKYPFVGGSFIRRPGFIRGKSMPRLIAHITNALNNIYNQKSDFQYVTNCPFGFHKPDENFDRQVYELEPGVSYPTDDPKNVMFPNLSRSMAWADSDIRLLLELLERMTGAASYFMSNSQGVSGTATRDAIINEKSETRFGLWVKRIIDDICEAIDMWLMMYQDCAPPNLAERVLGEDGKKLFTNLSIETLQGEYTSYMSPDIISGSKTLEKQVALWALEQAQVNPWLNFQINPRGNWELTANTFKKMGMMDIENYLPPKPRTEFGMGDEVDKIWAQFMAGEVVEVDPAQNNAELFAGLIKKAEKDYYQLDEEYRPNFDSYMFKLSIFVRELMQKAQEEAIATQMAMNMIKGINTGVQPQLNPQQLVQPVQQTPDPLTQEVPGV